MLIPLFVLLLFSSTRETRRKPIFIANVVSIMIGLILAGVAIALLLSELLNPLQDPNIPLYLVYNIFIGCSPLLVESILLMRLLAVYPFRTTPLKKFLAIFIPITLLKLARLANLIVYLVSFYDQLRTGEQILSSVQELCSTRFRNYTVEFPLQVMDNTSTSVLFLVKLNEVRAFRSTVRGWSSALEALFWIAISNFVIPVMLSIAQLVVVWMSKDFAVLAMIFTVNVYVEIIGVLMATIWVVGSRWREKDSSDAPVLTTVTVGMEESPTGYSGVGIEANPWTTEK